jgi:hypothetical protein
VPLVTAHQPGKPRGGAAEKFPALREFFRGYLHEDAIEAHGSVEGAARQFWCDADEEQRQTLEAEWQDLRARLRDQKLGAVNQALRDLGSARQFAGDDLEKISAVFSRGSG